MNGTPLVWDLYCCGGGAGMGYRRAGLHVKGFDIRPRPRYAGHEFERTGALRAVRELLAGERERPDLIHWSPPCQVDNPLTRGTNRSRGWGTNLTSRQVIPVMRKLILATKIPYVLEQPVTIKGLIRHDLMLCMDMFPIGEPPWVQRHRYFEIEGFTVAQPVHPAHRGYVRGLRHGVDRDGPYVAAYGDGGGKATVAEMQHALGIDWTDVREELTEAIPPAYTEHIGRAFLAGGTGQLRLDDLFRMGATA